MSSVKTHSSQWPLCGLSVFLPVISLIFLAASRKKNLRSASGRAGGDFFFLEAARKMREIKRERARATNDESRRQRPRDSVSDWRDSAASLHISQPISCQITFIIPLTLYRTVWSLPPRSTTTVPPLASAKTLVSLAARAIVKKNSTPAPDRLAPALPRPASDLGRAPKTSLNLNPPALGRRRNCRRGGSVPVSGAGELWNARPRPNIRGGEAGSDATRHNTTQQHMNDGHGAWGNRVFRLFPKTPP